MTICIDARCLSAHEQTGVGEVVAELFRSLLVAHPEHRYIFLTTGTISPKEKLSSFVALGAIHTHRFIPNKILHASLLLLRRPYLDFLVGEPVDVFVSPNIHFTSVSPKTPVIQIIHDLSFEIEPAWYSWKRRLWHTLASPKKLSARAAKIIVPSQQTKQDVEELYTISSGQVAVIPWGVASIFSMANHATAVREKYDIKNRFFFSLATLEPRKNLNLLLDAYEKGGYAKEHIDLILAGSGGWSSAEVQKRIAHIPGARYIGYVEHQERVALYREAELFVYPSLYEGFGLPPLEAICSGTPVIASTRPALPEVTQGLATLVSAYNVDDLVRALTDAVARPLSQEERLRRATLCRSLYSWDTAAEAFYREVLSI